jgi:carbon storage regulator
MLVLTRRVDESIAIGDSIVLTVLAIEGDRVKLGIAAPRDILILRQEIYQAVQEQAKLEELLVEEPEPDTFQKLRELLATSDDQDKKEDNGEGKDTP